MYGNDYSTPDGTGLRDYIHVVVRPSLSTCRCPEYPNQSTVEQLTRTTTCKCQRALVPASFCGPAVSSSVWHRIPHRIGGRELSLALTRDLAKGHVKAIEFADGDKALGSVAINLGTGSANSVTPPTRSRSTDWRGAARCVAPPLRAAALRRPFVWSQRSEATCTFACRGGHNRADSARCGEVVGC